MKSLLILFLVFTAQQDQDYHKESSVWAFEKPPEFPGIVLEPGTYVFKAEQFLNKRIFIEILNLEKTKVLAKVLALSDHRYLDRNNDGIFTYHKTASEKPRVIRSWYRPGNLNGYEFVYSKERSKEIAKESDNYVLALDGNDFETSRIVAILPNGVELQMNP